MTGEWTVVDGELHLHGGRVDLDEGECLHVWCRGEGVADVDIVEAGEADDVSGDGFLNVVGREAGEGLHLGDFDAVLGAVFAKCVDGLALFDLSGEDAADRHAADVVVPVDVGDEHAEVAVFDDGGRDALDDGFEEVVHVLAWAIDLAVGEAVFGGGVEEGGVELIFVGIEVEEELEHLVVHPVWARGVAVDLVDHTDGLEAGVEGLAKHPAGLRLWATDGVGEEEDAVDHLHHALDLGAEVGVAGGVDDIDGVSDAVLRVLPLDGGVLRLDGDAFLALKIHGVHRALFDGLVLAEGATLLEQAVAARGNSIVAYRGRGALVA